MLEEFEEKGVRAVVRLNKKLYDRNHFLERGIQHIESKFTTHSEKRGKYADQGENEE